MGHHTGKGALVAAPRAAGTTSGVAAGASPNDGEPELLAELAQRGLAGNAVRFVAREAQRALECLVGIAGLGARVSVHGPLAFEQAQGQQRHLDRAELHRVQAVALRPVGVGLEGGDHLGEIDALLLARRYGCRRGAGLGAIELRSPVVHVSVRTNALFVVQVRRDGAVAGLSREGNLLALEDLLAGLAVHVRQVGVHVLDRAGLDNHLDAVCRSPASPTRVQHRASPRGEHGRWCTSAIVASRVIASLPRAWRVEVTGDEMQVRGVCHDTSPGRALRGRSVRTGSSKAKPGIRIYACERPWDTAVQTIETGTQKSPPTRTLGPSSCARDAPSRGRMRTPRQRPGRAGRAW